MTIAEAAHLTAATLNPALPIQIDGIPNPAAPLNSYVPDITRAHTELGLRVTHTPGRSPPPHRRLAQLVVTPSCLLGDLHLPRNRIVL